MNLFQRMKRTKTMRPGCFPALFLAAALLLCGCHGAARRETFTVPEQLDESRTFELTFWAKNDTNKAQTEVYQKAIDDFQALYPNVHITMRLYTDYSRIYNDVITNIATNTTPNVCITYPDHIATYLTGNGVVAPLDDLMADPQYGLGGSALRFDGPAQSEMVPQFLNEGIVNGAQYALPFMRSTEACYINKTLVESLGYEVPDVLTWDYVWEVSEAAAKRNADGTYPANGQKVLIPLIYKSTDNMMIQMLRQKGAGYSTASGRIDIFNETTREILLTVAAHASTGAFSTFKISSYPANFLNAGQCVFAIDSTAGSTWMGSDAPLSDISPDQFVEFETAVRSVPQFDTEHPQMISQGPSVCVFNKADPQEVLASWLFAQFLLTNNVQLSYSFTEGYLPVTTKAQNDPAYQEYLSLAGTDTDTHYAVKIEAAKLLMDNIDNTFVTPVFNGSASLRSAAGQMIENVTKAVRRNQTVDDAFLDKTFDDVTSLYRLDQLQPANSGAKADLGPLPTESKILLGTLAAVWACMGLYWLSSRRRSRRRHAKQ